MSLDGKRLLILGGMRFSCEIVTAARSMGVHTIVADYNRTEDSPAKQISDESVELSVTDVDAVVEYIRGHSIDGVIVGFNDMLLPYYADICEKSGLPCYGSKEQFLTLTSKDKYKSLCRRFGVPVIQEYSIGDPDIMYPVLVKPVDNSGSRGITICRNHVDLEHAVAVGIKASKSGKVLIERYIEGPEVTVFWIFMNGNYCISAFGNRHVKNNQGNDVIPLPVGYTFPSVFLEKYRAEVEDKCKRMFRFLGLKNGMMFMQCKVEGGTCYLYDLGFRLTGSLEYKIIEKASGYNPLEMIICHSLSGSMGDKDISSLANPEFKEPAFNVSCLCKSGRIKEIVGVEEVKAIPGVLDVVLGHVAGETITEDMRGLLSQIAVRVLGTVPAKEELGKTMKKINDTIGIRGEGGQELLLPGIDYDDINGFI